jgi:cytochrome c-type biogenesis protein CcmF
MLKRWTAGLAAGTFALCVLGAYVTRSGVVQSVHAYAASPVGHLLLGLLATVVAASAVIFVSGASGLVDSPPPDDQPRRTGSVNLARLANILLVTMAAATLVGTMFPVLSRLWSSTPVSLSPAYYHRTVAPLGVTTIGLMAVWPLACGLARDELRRRLRPALAVAALGVGACVWAGVREPVVLCCVVIAAVAVSTILIDLARSVLAHARQTGFGLGRSVVMVLDRAHGRLGSQIAHTGMALVLIGLAGSSLLGQRGAMMLTPGGSATIGRPLQTVRLETINEVRGDNFTAAEAVLTLEGPDGSAVRLMPQRRYYDRFGEPTAEVAIRSTWRRDVYVAMTGWNGRDSRVALDVRINPLTLWIWIGAATVTLGGIVSLLPRVLPRPRVEATPWDDVRKGSNPSHEAPSSERASKP